MPDYKAMAEQAIKEYQDTDSDEDRQGVLDWIMDQDQSLLEELLKICVEARKD